MPPLEAMTLETLRMLHPRRAAAGLRIMCLPTSLEARTAARRLVSRMAAMSVGSVRASSEFCDTPAALTRTSTAVPSAASWRPMASQVPGSPASPAKKAWGRGVDADAAAGDAAAAPWAG